MFVLPFSQMYAVFILWPVPAENCIFFKKKSYRGMWTAWIFNHPFFFFGLHSSKYTDIFTQDVILNGFTVGSAERSARKRKLNKVSRKTYCKCSRQTNSAKKKPRIGK